MNYDDYLKKEGYTEKTICTKDIERQNFTKWCKRQSTTPVQIDYKTCLKYIKHLTRKGNSKRTINHKLGSLKTYFNYLISEAYRMDNPIETVVVRGARRNINHNLLESEELEDLYYSFETEKARNQYLKYRLKRDKIIIGLLVYQGLSTSDLGSLKLEHLRLSKGKLYVPSRNRSNARELELKPWQIMELMEYINEIREKLLKQNNIQNDQLILHAMVSNLVSATVRKLKKINHKVESIHQIRASVITNWLGQYNLRKVQYLAGHRYISSTERYLQDDLENLHEIVNNYHPIS
ncbi:tyrosine-type recombinase/integrase [Aquimarina sp. W85]|uniref:tyrosine-type recombinase/integrase n=1 Tax=Aquimarina rhodophyticola TaxID=3342246 RepID=UPI00366B5F8D